MAASEPLVLRRDDGGTALVQTLGGLQAGAAGSEPVLTALRRFPAEPARYAEFPEDLHPDLRHVLRARGISRLYTHQREAWDAVRAGSSTVVVTPTASGKTLCYNLPILDRILKDPDARALYLFPTKALAQDQLAELLGLIEALGADVRAFTYDGDTPQDARKAVRMRAHVVVTNPDMLHRGILPHHPKWVKLFESLRYVVVDELHVYRGVFGSHVANVFRRLQRLCRFYGSDPQFLCSSATIGNPRELGERLTGRSLTLIDRSGAPRGERHFAIYNPPVVNRPLGIRRSALRCARDVALSFLARGLQTIVFAPSRLATEVLVTYLKEALERTPGAEGLIRGYRGGYLPLKRREIERGLREGSVLGVVSTNALELGVDIGGLDVAVLLGYPGSVASAWQQAGRAGRRTGTSAAVLVANSTPLNQFIARHPDYLFGSPIEQARLDPDNLEILLAHLKCAAFELPFTAGETFGDEDLLELLHFLEEQGFVHRAADRWHWSSEGYPAEGVSLRAVSSDNFVVHDVTGEPRAIAEVDYQSAPALVHEKAVYLLEGRAFLVERHDHEARRVYVREAEVDYYTDAVTHTEVHVVECRREEPAGRGRRSHGEVHVASQVVGFKKIKFHTHENVGAGDLRMTPREMDTTSYWLTVPGEVMAALPFGAEARRDGVVALAHTLGQMAALFLLCDRHDLGVSVSDGGLPAYQPTLFIYDNYPGGIGLAEPLYRLHGRLMAESRALIASCPCPDGCPSCVGPSAAADSRGKEVALALLDRLRENADLTPGLTGPPRLGHRSGVQRGVEGSAFTPADTSPEAWEAQNEAYRRMGGPGRSAAMFQLIALTRENARAGIRARHPDYDEGQVQRALARVCLGDELVRQLWPGQPLVEP